MGALATSTPGADRVVQALGTGKISSGWLDLTTLFTEILDTQFSVVDASDVTKGFKVAVPAGMTTAKFLTLDLGSQTDSWSLAVPVLAGNDTIVTLATTQTISGVKTFSTPIAAASGGTGVNNAGTLTNASNTTITGGGTIALGGFTLTVPATGTAALLATANTFSAIQTVSNATSASSTSTGALVVAGGVGIGGASYFGSTLNQNLDGLAYGNIGASINNRYMRISNTGGLIYVGVERSAGGSIIGGATAYAAIVSSDGATDLNLGSNGTMRINVTAAGPVSFTAAAPLTLLSATASTSATTGALIIAGGIGVAKASYFESISSSYAMQIVNTNAVTAPGLFLQAGRTTDFALRVENAAGSAIFTLNGNGVVTSYSTTLATTGVPLTNGAAAAVGTLTNAPAAGNPTKWIPINDNGTTRYIPAW